MTIELAKEKGIKVDKKGFEKDNTASVVLSSVKDSVKFIEKATSIESFEIYKEDKRATVVKAIKAKTIELEG